MNKDTLKRDDTPTGTLFEEVSKAVFEALSEETKRLLIRVASRKRGGANVSPAVKAEIDRDWIMVPTKRGYRQVVVTETRIFIL